MNIVQINMTEIDISVTNVAIINLDPGAAFVETDAAPDPVVAPTTAGPHRYTVYVPNPAAGDETSILNVGAGDRIPDLGITGRTKSHVHWHTTTIPTIVALGGPTEEGEHFEEQQGGNNLGANAGYMVVTEAKYWTDAHDQHYSVSRHGDIVVRTAGHGKRAVLQADAGDVDVNAHHNVNIAAPTINLSAPMSMSPPPGINYGDPWTAELPSHNISKAAGLITEAAVALGTSIHLKGQRKAMKKKMEHGHSAAAHVSMWSKALWAATAARTAKVAADVTNHTAHLTHGGVTNIHSSLDTQVSAGNLAFVYGGAGATLCSTLFSTVVAGLLAEVEGGIFAGVAGMRASLEGSKEVEICAGHGPIGIEAHDDVHITAEHGHLKAGAHKDVFLRSETTGAALHGAKRVYAAAGGATSWGLVADTSQVSLGQMSSGEDLNAAAVVAKQALVVNDKQIVLESDGARIELAKGQMYLSAKNAWTSKTDGNTTFEAPKILIG